MSAAVIAFPSPALRWQAEIVYRTVVGPMTLTFQVEEIEDVAKAVEEGPDWRCIEAIAITICRARAAFAEMHLPLKDGEEDGA